MAATSNRQLSESSIELSKGITFEIFCFNSLNRKLSFQNWMEPKSYSSYRKSNDLREICKRLQLAIAIGNLLIHVPYRLKSFKTRTNTKFKAFESASHLLWIEWRYKRRSQHALVGCCSKCCGIRNLKFSNRIIIRLAIILIN